MRKWTPYELNQLIKYGFPLDDLENYGEKPVEYITGRADFGGLVFEVTPGVLIPRIETEQMLELADAYCQGKSNLKIADVACGSGCIGIALAKRLNEKGISFAITLSDISPLALKVARKNADRLLPRDLKLSFIESDLLEKFSVETFDLILANLPYVPSKRLPLLPKSVIGFEPVVALDGGVDGLLYIRKLLTEAVNFLKPRGEVIFEIDETHQLADLIRFSEFSYSIKQDQFGKNRFLLGGKRQLDTNKID